MVFSSEKNPIFPNVNSSLYPLGGRAPAASAERLHVLRHQREGGSPQNGNHEVPAEQRCGDPAVETFGDRPGARKRCYVGHGAQSRRCCCEEGPLQPQGISSSSSHRLHVGRSFSGGGDSKKGQELSTTLSIATCSGTFREQIAIVR